MSRRLTRTEGCSVVVEFAPTTSGHRSAALSVTSSDGTPVVVALDGTASYQPSLVLVGTSAQAGASVTVSGTGFPAAGDLSLSWDVGPTVTVHTDANGAFHTVVDTTAVSAGWREVIVSDEVPPGLDRRFAPVVSATVEIADGTAGGGANSAAFGA
jgi:hypothetical protein